MNAQRYCPRRRSPPCFQINPGWPVAGGGDRHIAQTDVAKALGLTFQQVQKYEKGINRVAPSRLELIARACGVPVSAFMPSLDDHKKNGGPTPFAELRVHGAQALLAAYGKIKDSKSRAALVALARSMALAGEA